MNSRYFFDKNVLSLSSRNKTLAVNLGRAEAAQNVVFRKSRTGADIPFVVSEGRERPLHSTVDPLREAEKYFKNSSVDGYLVFLGFGAAYHIRPFLEQDNISEILIIDKDISLFKSILSNIDLSKFILDRRIKFLIDPEPSEVKDHLLSTYLPAVSGNLHILKLRSRYLTEQNYFDDISAEISEIIEFLSEDFSVQSHFGKRWFVNTLANLQKAQNTKNILPHIKTAIVSGAGPSLEIQIPFILDHRDESFLIATDTSLPSLLGFGITPDVVISIDCQHITYHHFMSGYPKGVPLVLDLASPSWLSRITENTVYFTSGHPFSKYVNSQWRKFPYIDTSGGNVSHAAVSLAEKLGASLIYLCGVDFSYPEGKSYARGTYLYPYFSSFSDRLQPQENKFVDFIFYNKITLKNRKNYGFSYTTTPMISYKKRLEDAAKSISARIVQVETKGETLDLRDHDSGISGNNRIISFFSAGSIHGTWKEFINDYRQKLEDLPEPGISLTEYITDLSPEQRDICTTLYPAAAALRRSDFQDNMGASIIKDAINWTLAQIDSFITW